MTVKFYMDKPAIKQAAIDFKQALLDWKDRDKILETFKQNRDSWTEEQFENTVLYCSNQIDSIFKVLNPILDLALAGDIDEPFDFLRYSMSKVGRVFSDELSYPEIRIPYERLIEVLIGGLTQREFWETDYCKLSLMPKNLRE